MRLYRCVNSSYCCLMLLLWVYEATSHRNVTHSTPNDIQNNTTTSTTNYIALQAMQDSYVPYKKMQDPQLCPSCCGISRAGWICDPDGMLNKLAGNEETADRFNNNLWVIANTGVCPCREPCLTRKASIYVAVIRKLPYEEDKTENEQIVEAAKYLLKRWSTNVTTCQPEILIVVSVEDGLITTQIGTEIQGTGMMTYEDVDLVSSTLSGDSLVSKLDQLIYVYGLFIDHPSPHTMAPYNSTFNVTEGTRLKPQSPRISATAVALIVAGIIIILFVLLGICITKSFRCTTDQTPNNKQTFTE